MNNNIAGFQHVEMFVWSATDALRGAVDSQACVDVTAATLLIKYLSERWAEQYEPLRKRFGDDHAAVQARMKHEPLQIPGNARFDFIYENRHDPEIIRYIQDSLAAIQSSNTGELSEVAEYLFSAMKNPILDSPQSNAAVVTLFESVMGFSQALVQDRSKAVEIVDLYYALINRYEAHVEADKSQSTPFEVGQLLIALITPQSGETVYDPSCGSGGLLMDAGRYAGVLNNDKSSSSLLGQDNDKNRCLRSKLGMLLSGERDFLIKQGDYLRAPAFTRGSNKLQQFDVVLANNSFSTQEWPSELALNDPYGRFSYGQPPKARGDYALILHMLASLKAEAGRMALVTNLGVLHRSGSEAEIRKRLIEVNLIDAVILLPPKLFPHTANAAVVLLIKKNKTDNAVIFMDASAEFDPGKSQNRLNDAAIENILTAYQNRENTEGYSYVAAADEIADNNYSLSISHYVRQKQKEKSASLAQLKNERLSMTTELDNVGRSLDRLIDSLVSQ